MRLDSHNGNLVRVPRALCHGEAQFRDEHGEGGFVDGVEGIGGRGQLSADGPEPGCGLCGGIDGDGEGFAGANELLRGGYTVWHG